MVKYNTWLHLFNIKHRRKHGIKLLISSFVIFSVNMKQRENKTAEGIKYIGTLEARKLPQSRN